MENVQVHPTAFVDPKRPSEEQKTLCAEILRGVGGILLDKNGKRFVNELGRRDYVVLKMKQADADDLQFTILMSEGASLEADKHVPLYKGKGLLKELPNLEAVAEWIKVPYE